MWLESTREGFPVVVTAGRIPKEPLGGSTAERTRFNSALRAGLADETICDVLT